MTIGAAFNGLQQLELSPGGPGEQGPCLPLPRPNDPRGTASRPGGVTGPGPAQIVTSTHNKSGQTENQRIINRVKQHGVWIVTFKLQSLPPANEVAERHCFRSCLSVILFTRGRVYLKITPDASDLRGPPGHVQNCSSCTSLYSPVPLYLN